MEKNTIRGVFRHVITALAVLFVLVFTSCVLLGTEQSIHAIREIGSLFAVGAIIGFIVLLIYE